MASSPFKVWNESVTANDLAAQVRAVVQGDFHAATKAQLDANTTALSGTVDSDGANNGTYARTVRTDPSTPWTKTSDATLPGLASIVANKAESSDVAELSARVDAFTPDNSGWTTP
jgi:hypothetical protein